jgi:hypothetical protein
MWVVQYFNGALLLTLIATRHTKIIQTSDDQGVQNEWIPILAGDYVDFDYRWYNDVG